jgi:hypothetical protein
VALASPFFYDFSGSARNTLTAININTGVGTAIGTTGIPGISGFVNITAEAFAPSGAFYAVGQDASGNHALITVNLLTGVGTLVVDLPAGDDPISMDIAHDDTMYFAGGNSELHELPPNDFNPLDAQDVGNMGVANFLDFALSPSGGLYALGLNTSSPYGSSIYSINTTSAASTLVGWVSNPLTGIAFSMSGTLFATDCGDQMGCTGPEDLLKITGLSSNNPNGARAVSLGTNTGFSNMQGGDIDDYTPEPASLGLCLLGGVLLAARKIYS